MYTEMYMEINLLCIGILVILLFREHRSADRQVGRMDFVWVSLSVLSLLVLDMLWVLVETYTQCRILNEIINTFYFFQTGLVAYLWLQYVNRKLGRTRAISRTERVLTAVPLALLLLVCALNPWLRWLFSIDENNVYQRGVMHIAQLAVCYGYILCGTAMALHYRRRETNRETRSEYLTLACFILLPALGSALQVCFPGVPAAWPAATLSILMVYIGLQSKQISTDALTGLNNRRQLDKHLQLRIGEAHGARRLYLLMMDIDNFKGINDTYGHPEGDYALTAISNVLKLVCGKRNVFLARYGGDEFAAVLQSESRAAVEALMEEIRAALKRYTAPLKLRYPLMLSMGYAEFNEDGADTIPALIERADAAMYQDKQRPR